MANIRHFGKLRHDVLWSNPNTLKGNTMSNKPNGSKAGKAKPLNFQAAVLTHNARIVKDLSGPSVYRHSADNIAFIEPGTGMWFVMSRPSGKHARRVTLASGTLGATPAGCASNSNVLAEDNAKFQAKLRQIHDARVRARIVPPELEINLLVLQHGTMIERDARMQLMRDTVRGHRQFTEVEATEFHILRSLVEAERAGLLK
jgi:hypothetical protein